MCLRADSDDKQSRNVLWMSSLSNIAQTCFVNVNTRDVERPIRSNNVLTREIVIRLRNGETTRIAMHNFGCSLVLHRGGEGGEERYLLRGGISITLPTGTIQDRAKADYSPALPFVVTQNEKPRSSLIQGISIAGTRNETLHVRP